MGTAKIRMLAAKQKRVQKQRTQLVQTLTQDSIAGMTTMC
jgi:hypothetical protein